MWCAGPKDQLLRWLDLEPWESRSTSFVDEQLRIRPLPALESEVDRLTEEVAKLWTAIADLRRGQRRLQQDLESEAPSDSRAREERSADSRSWTRVSPSPTPSRTTSYPSPSASRGVPHLPSRGSGLQSAPESLPSSSAGQLTWIERENICDEIGAFIARSLEGNHRGASGRDRLPHSSRIFIIVRDYAGQIYQPVKVVRSWGSCKLLCKPQGQDPGDSIFVGLPSEREAGRVVAAAGLIWPQAIEP